MAKVRYIDECVPATVQQINPTVNMYCDITDWSSVIPVPTKADTHYVHDRVDGNYTLITYHCGFDTEFYTKTTIKSKRIRIHGKHNTIKVVDTAFAYMYVWQMSINDQVIIGRTWDEFIDTIEKIHTICQTNSARKIRIWVANLGCEFQFIRKYLKIKKLFARSTREPIIVELDNGIILQDCLAISGGSLAQLAKDYTPTQKLKGDLDYTIPRNSKTPLTPEEIGYCVNDVVILAEYDTYLHETYTKQGHEIPMTQTGIDRKAVQKRFKEAMSYTGADNKQYPDTRKVFNHIQCYPHTPKEYNILTQYVYRGGYTHSNIIHTGMVLHDVNGWDYTSDYPAVMLQCQYPMTPFIEDKTINSIDKLPKGKAWYAMFMFKNIKSTTVHSIESVSKTAEYKFCNGSQARLSNDYGYVIDNGRVDSANQMSVWLTDLDWQVYQKYYKWDDVQVIGVRVAEYGMLPEYLTAPIKNAYKEKNQIKIYLKSIGEDNSPAYAISKAKLNGFYGLCVQKLVMEEITYVNDHWGSTPGDGYYDLIGCEYNDQYDTLNLKKGRRYPKLPLLPQWGVWVCAHARKRLLDMVYAIGADVVYCDTDSLYCLNVAAHQSKIDAYNKAVKDWNIKNLGQEFAELGTFDKLNKTDYTEFKTLGAKRYVKTGYNDKKKKVETHVTIAGLPKGTLEEYCEKNNLDIYETFTDGLMFEMSDANKNAHKYNDSDHADYITDEYGNTEYMSEKSSLGIYQTTFGMSLDDFYANLIMTTASLARNEVSA